MKRLLLWMPALCLLWSCHFSNPASLNTSKNTRIDKNIRASVQATNKELIHCLMEGDMVSFKNIASDALIADIDGAKDSVIQVQGKRIVNPNFKILDEYYTKNPMPEEEVFIDNNSRKGSEYAVSYKAINKESYTSLLVLKVDSFQEMLLTVVYGKYGPNWLINIIYFGDYSYNGKNAKGLFNTARQYMRDSDIADTHINIVMAQSCSKPASNIVKFKSDTAIDNYLKYIEKAASQKYNFPIPIVTIDSKPEILMIKPFQLTNEGVFPIVYYKTSIPLKNISQLKKENELMRKRIGSIFKGIDQNKKYLLYRAFNEIKKDEESEYYGFLDDLTKDND